MNGGMSGEGTAVNRTALSRETVSAQALSHLPSPTTPDLELNVSIDAARMARVWIRFSGTDQIPPSAYSPGWSIPASTGPYRNPRRRGVRDIPVVLTG